ncbi:hypothetical protein FQN50_005299 [Emmonsiellopsis sp. PD_5]|nr:hypothetical protein FQN50_005299 [Emmonsiellopsis sp. PD_5]
MQRLDNAVATSGAPSPIVPTGRSRHEILAVGRAVQMASYDNPLAGRRGSVRWGHEDAGRNFERPTTATSTQANCGNPLDLIKLLDGQHEPMHPSAPYKLVVRLLKSGRKRLRQLEHGKPKVWKKDTATRDGTRRIENSKSSIWGLRSTTKDKTKRKENENVTSTSSEEEKLRKSIRRKWVVVGTGSKNSRLIEYEDRDFLYPGIGRLPPASVEGDQERDDCNRSLVLRPQSQQRVSGESFWQRRLDAGANHSQKTEGFGDNNLGTSDGPTANAGTETTRLKPAGESPGASSPGALSTPPNGCQNTLTIDRYKASYHGENTESKLLLQHPDVHVQTLRLEQIVAASSNPSALVFHQPQVRDNPSQAKNPTPPLPEISSNTTTATQPNSKSKKLLRPLSSGSAHIDLQCLPPRISSKGACRSSSLFAALTYSRRRSSSSKHPLVLNRRSAEVQSLNSFLPRPVRASTASAPATPSIMSFPGDMQPPHAMTTSARVEPNMRQSYASQVSSNSPSSRVSSPRPTTGRAASLPPAHPNPTPFSKYGSSPTGSTKLQDSFILTPPGEQLPGNHSTRRPLSSRASLEGKKLRCLGMSDSSKISTQSLDKMSRAERVFALRMRDMCAARAGLKKDSSQTAAVEGSTPDEVRQGWEEQTSSKDVTQAKQQAKTTDESTISHKSQRNDSPGAPPNIPLPADPPNKKIPGNQNIPNSPLGAAIKAETPVSIASSDGSTHRSNSNRSWSSRSARSATDAPHNRLSSPAGHRNSNLRPDSLKEGSMTSAGPRPLTPLPPPLSDEEDSGVPENCGNCVSCSQMQDNPNPPDSSRKNTLFSKDNRSKPRLHNFSRPQSPHRESLNNDPIAQPLTPLQNTPPNPSNRNSNNTSLPPSSPQSSIRPRSQDPSSHPQCEARIAFLERQNKMLQAALIAALDVGVTFDADLVHSGTATPPTSITTAGSENNFMDTKRQSYASTTTSRTTTSTNRRSIDGRRSYIKDKSVEPAGSMVRSRSVRDSRIRQYRGDSYYGGDKKLGSDGDGLRR